jgi:hypothetical protein
MPVNNVRNEAADGLCALVSRDSRIGAWDAFDGGRRRQRSCVGHASSVVWQPTAIEMTTNKLKGIDGTEGAQDFEPLPP